MAKIDNLKPDIRAVIHEYGWPFVDELLKLGCTSARQMRHIAVCVGAGRGAGSEIRDPPNEAEANGVANILAGVYGRPKQLPTGLDREAARQTVGYLWKHFHWGRCRCVK
jgi:hypothetical protein